MTHAVDRIAESFRSLLFEATDAQDRVSRDNSPAERFEASRDLPAIDVRVGEEEPLEEQSTTYVGQVRIEVDLFVSDVEQNVSSAVLTLRTQAHKAIAAGADQFLSLQPAGATAILRNAAGSIPVGFQTAHFDVLFQHSLADPST